MVEVTYATFFKAPIAFTLFAVLPLGAFALLLIFAIADASMVEEGSDPRLALVAPFLLTYVVFVFCLGVLLSGAFRVTRRGLP